MQDDILLRNVLYKLEGLYNQIDGIADKYDLEDFKDQIIDTVQLLGDAELDDFTDEILDGLDSVERVEETLDDIIDTIDDSRGKQVL